MPMGEDTSRNLATLTEVLTEAGLVMSAFSLLVSISGTAAATSVPRMVLKFATGGLMGAGIAVICSDPAQ